MVGGRITLALTALLAAACVAGRELEVGKWTKPDFYHDKEGPHYKAVKAPEGTPYEIRDYEATAWAGYNVEGNGFVVAEGKAYTQLTRYFKGANKGDVHLDLTTPVATLFLPNEDYSSAAQNFTIYFYLEDETPKPEVDGVFLEEAPAITSYVRSFGGYASESSILSEAKALLGDLEADKVSFESGFFTFSSYDSPARIVNRHNEVAFLKEAPTGRPHHRHHAAPRGPAAALHRLYAKVLALAG